MRKIGDGARMLRSGTVAARVGWRLTSETRGAAGMLRCGAAAASSSGGWISIICCTLSQWREILTIMNFLSKFPNPTTSVATKLRSNLSRALSHWREVLTTMGFCEHISKFHHQY